MTSEVTSTFMQIRGLVDSLGNDPIKPTKDIASKKLPFEKIEEKIVDKIISAVGMNKIVVNVEQQAPKDFRFSYWYS